MRSVDRWLLADYLTNFNNIFVHAGGRVYIDETVVNRVYFLKRAEVGTSDNVAAKVVLLKYLKALLCEYIRNPAYK